MEASELHYAAELTSLSEVTSRINDVLGYDVDAWLNEVHAGMESCTRRIDRAIEPATLTELTELFYWRHWKFRVTHRPDFLFIKVPKLCSESVCPILLSTFMQNNMHRTRDYCLPIEAGGFGDVEFIGGGIFKPDGQFGVITRSNHMSLSPNLTLDVHYGSTEPMDAFLSRLEAQIELTDGVMLVLGVKIYRRTVPAER